MNLPGKKVIVTGGVKGLGRAMVDTLVAQECLVTVFDIDESGFGTLKDKHPGLQCIACDVSDYDQVSAATESYFGEHGSPDVLINNAGILYSEPLIKITESGLQKHDPLMWDRVLRINLSSVFYLTTCIVEKMVATRTKGVIVNISSVSAAGNPGASAYSAAKAGVNALTQSVGQGAGTDGYQGGRSGTRVYGYRVGQRGNE